MKKATIAGATFEFGEAQALAVKDTVQKATIELKDHPEQLAEFLNEQVRKIAGIKSPESPAKTPLEGKRILWVDDKPENNTYESNLLARLGAKIEFSVSTKEAIQALSQAFMTSSFLMFSAWKTALEIEVLVMICSTKSEINGPDFP
jgi:PleD family two-component response regulator